MNASRCIALLTLLCAAVMRAESRSAASAAAEYAAMEMVAEKSATGGQTANQCSASGLVKDRIFTFAFCGEMRPYHFIDEMSGKLMGLGVDMVNEACARADRLCATIVVKDTMSCWNSETDSSRGLDDKWYDSIVDMVNTVERSRSYAFVGLIAKAPMAYFYAKEGSSIARMNKITHTIGFSKDSWMSESCLMRLKKYPENKMMYDSNEALKMALNEGKVDLALMVAADAAGLKKLEGGVQCAAGGLGVMVRKDMAYEMWWVDDAMKKIATDGKYERLCYIARKAYGAEPMCISV